MRLLLAMSAYLGALLVIAPTMFFVVMVLAGPHAGLLPQPVEAIVLVLGWLCVIMLPVWAARTVWIRARRTEPSRSAPETAIRPGRTP